MEIIRQKFTIAMQRMGGAAWATVLLFSLLCACLHPSDAFAKSQKIKPKATYKTWRLFVEGRGRTQICYLIGKPRQSRPRKVRRGDIFLSVSHRPGQGVRHEVSVHIGYPFSETSKPFARVGNREFAFFTGAEAQTGNEEWAWLRHVDAQPRLVTAMKRGNILIFKGISARGTLTTDRYSLDGFTAAMRALNKACPRR